MLPSTFIKRFLSIFSILFLCSGSVSADEIKSKLIGEIDAETGQYTSADKGFQVTIPIKGTRDHVLNTLTDAFTARGTLLSVQPKKNGSTYRLETTHALDEHERKEPFSQASLKTFDWYRRLAIRSYREPLVELYTYSFKLNGRDSVGAIYKQFSSKTQGPRFHLFYLTDFGDELAFIWTDIPLVTENINIEEKIINGTAEQVKNSIAMLNSLTFE